MLLSPWALWSDGHVNFAGIDATVHDRGRLNYVSPKFTWAWLTWLSSSALTSASDINIIGCVLTTVTLPMEMPY